MRRSRDEFCSLDEEPVPSAVRCKSGAPVQTTLMLVTTYGLMFGIGAALTGLVLTLEDES